MITALTVWIWDRIGNPEDFKKSESATKWILSAVFIFSLICAMILDIRILGAVR